MPPPSLPRRVPLLWLLGPYCLGLCLARFGIALPTLGAALVAGLCLIGSIYTAHRNLPLWTALVCVGTVFIGQLRLAGNIQTTSIELNTVREASVEMEITTLFNATDPATELGLATIRTAPQEQPHLLGQRVFFFLDNRSSSSPQKGETFSAIGVVRPLRGYEDGDRFDAYLRNLGVHLVLKQGYLLSKTNDAIGLDAFSNAARNKIASVLEYNKAPDSRSTGALKALMLGQKSELSSEQKQLFLSNGAMHLFAISGLHIGVIALCIHQSLTLFRFKGRTRTLLALGCLATFVVITGNSASAWRAFLMVACLYLAQATRKQSSPIAALVFSAFLYLLISPGQLFTAGFQMSYFTVASILLLGLPLGRTLCQAIPLFESIPKGLRNPVQNALVASKNWILSAAGVSLSASLCSSLLGIYYFQLLPSYSFLINLIALPIASLALVAGFISILVAPLNLLVPASYLFNNAAVVLLEAIQFGLSQTVRLPWSSIATNAVPALLAGASVLSCLVLYGVVYAKSNSPRSGNWLIAAVGVSLCWIIALSSVR